MTLDDLQGHWRRNWITAPGIEDSTTRVHWLQAGRWCADIRIPLERPSLEDATCLADLAPAALAEFLMAEGFAGQAALDGDICTWTRTRNWRGFPAPVDAGRLWFDASGRLIEDGVHAEYREEWQHLPGSFAALAVGDDGLLLTGDTTFLLALGAADSPAIAPLAAALREGTASSRDAATVFASVYLLGHWQGDRGIADLSTQPYAEGRAVLTRGGQLTLPAFDGREITRTLPPTPLD